MCSPKLPNLTATVGGEPGGRGTARFVVSSVDVGSSLPVQRGKSLKGDSDVGRREREQTRQ